MASACYAEDLLLLRKHGAGTLEEDQIRSLADFYGVNLKAIDIASAGREEIGSQIDSPHILAVLVSADALDVSTGRMILDTLRRRKSGPVPAIIFGISDQTDQSELSFWSGGTIRACTRLQNSFQPTALTVNGPVEFTRQLSGLELPAVMSPVCNMEPTSEATAATVLAAKQADGTSAPLLVRTRTASQELFFVPKERLLNSAWKPAGISDSFSSMAPFILFFSNALGDYGWHSPGHYANLTIDDAWLIEPYGYLDYKSLSVEMEQHHFHTTVAFVPWNFDRSRPEVVELFKSHPELFSVCVHGNNHAHREFGEYRQNPLADQVADIRQGIARMERFTALTHIPYDRLMVFPHAVAPKPTFAALRTYGFLGTANSSNVPLGEPLPVDPIFFLRPYTTNYESLLSLYRYAAAGDIPRVDLAIQAFLGNPMLFYDHSSLFSAGIKAFNAHADFVNHIQPDTKWTTLGDIARHSYLLRKRADGGMDVLMLSSEMALDNPTDTEQVFHVRQSDAARFGGTLAIDGLPAHSDSSSEEILIIPAHKSRLLRMTYHDDRYLAQEKVSTANPYVFSLRMISDFRDLYFTKSYIGRSFVKAYYRYRWDSAELFLERNWWITIVCFIVGFGGFRYYLNRTSRPARP